MSWLVFRPRLGHKATLLGGRAETSGGSCCNVTDNSDLPPADLVLTLTIMQFPVWQGLSGAPPGLKTGEELTTRPVLLTDEALQFAGP